MGSDRDLPPATDKDAVVAQGTGKSMFGFIDRFIERRHPSVDVEAIRTSVQERNDDIGRCTAARFTRGNVNIQRGHFLTQADLDARHRDR